MLGRRSSRRSGRRTRESARRLGHEGARAQRRPHPLRPLRAVLPPVGQEQRADERDERQRAAQQGHAPPPEKRVQPHRRRSGACWWTVATGHLPGGELLRPRQAFRLLRLRSGVRRSGPEPSDGPGRQTGRCPHAGRSALSTRCGAVAADDGEGDQAGRLDRLTIHRERGEDVCADMGPTRER